MILVIDDAGTRGLGVGRIGPGVEQGLEDVGAIPPHGKANQPATVRLRIGTPRQQHRDDGEVPGADGVVQDCHALAGIVLGFLGRCQLRFAVEVVGNCIAIAEEGSGVDVGCCTAC